MTLLDKQILFASLIAQVIQKAFDLGYGVTFGEAYRPAFTAEYYASTGLGVKNSFHENRLAIDLILYKNRVWLKETSDYLPLGEYWESLSNPDYYQCTWGGRFHRPDGDHFSLGEI